MDSTSISQEMLNSFEQLNDDEKRVILLLIKTFLISRNSNAIKQSIEEYSRELERTNDFLNKQESGKLSLKRKSSYSEDTFNLKFDSFLEFLKESEKLSINQEKPFGDIESWFRKVLTTKSKESTTPREILISVNNFPEKHLSIIIKYEESFLSSVLDKLLIKKNMASLKGTLMPFIYSPSKGE